jgi:hypothetical protein
VLTDSLAFGVQVLASYLRTDPCFSAAI